MNLTPQSLCEIKISHNYHFMYLEVSITSKTKNKKKHKTMIIKATKMYLHLGAHKLGLDA